jgi:hypothetical protein
MTTLHVGVQSWIIQDGNYPDFRSGQEATFAPEFVPTLEPVADPGEPRLQHQQGGLYSARGRVVFVDPPAWVCDFGVLAYGSDDCPLWATVGTSVAGEIYLGIDPFDYVERLHKLPNMPALAYRFSITRIWLETTPWVQETDHDGHQFRRRKDRPPSFQRSPRPTHGRTTIPSPTTCWSADPTERLSNRHYASNTLHWPFRVGS